MKTRAVTSVYVLAFVGSVGLGAPPRYKLTILEPSEPGQETAAFGLNEQGDVAGYERFDNANRIRASLWRASGEQVIFDTLPGDYRIWATDVSDLGLVVGTGIIPAFGSLNVTWASTAENAPLTTNLQVAFNDSGAKDVSVRPGGSEIAGWLTSADTIGSFFLRQGFLKSDSAIGTPPQLIPRLGGWAGWANGVSPSRLAVGASTTSQGPIHAFSFRSGAGVTDLGTLGGNASEARAISDTDIIVGWANTPTGERHAFRRDEDVLVDLGTLGGRMSSAEAVNASGVVVGTSWTADDGVAAWVHADGVMRDLNEQVVGQAGLLLTHATDLNESGVIIGYGRRDGRTQGFVLEPTCAADYAEPAGVLDSSDVLSFLVAFQERRQGADVSMPYGSWDIFDVFIFLEAFGAGCP